MIPSASLAALLQTIPGDSRLFYVDCGARKGKLPRHFRRIKQAMYVGVEADADECTRLTAEARPRHQYIQAFLGGAFETRTFRITHNPACASLLEPNHDFLASFLELGDFFRVEREIEVQTVPLDACLETHAVPRADFLELDVQGSELDVLAGAERTLQRTIGVQAEVEFAPMYVNQPLFADVDAFLRARGFQLFDVSRYHVRRAALDAETPTRGQLLWGHALYLRDHRDLAPEMSARLVVLAMLLDLPDLAAEVLARLATSTSSDELQRGALRARETLTAIPARNRLSQLVERTGRWLRGTAPGTATAASRSRTVWRD